MTSRRVSDEKFLGEGEKITEAKKFSSEELTMIHDILTNFFLGKGEEVERGIKSLKERVEVSTDRSSFSFKVASCFSKTAKRMEEAHASSTEFSSSLKANLFREVQHQVFDHFNDQVKLSSDQMRDLAFILSDLVDPSAENYQACLNLCFLSFQEAQHMMIMEGRVEEAFQLGETARTLDLPVSSPLKEIPNILKTLSAALSREGVDVTTGNTQLIDSQLNIRSKTIQQGEKTETVCEFSGRLEPSLRLQLEASLQAWEKSPPPGVKIAKKIFQYWREKEGIFTPEDALIFQEHAEQWVVEVEGVGTFTIGADPDSSCLYERFVVTLPIDPSKSASDYENGVKSFFCKLGLESLLGMPGPEEKQRAEFLAICWTFFPRALAQMDDRDLQTQSIPVLIQKMNEKTDGAFEEIYKQNKDKVGYKTFESGYCIPFVTQSEMVRANGGAFILHGLRDAGTWGERAKLAQERYLSGGLIPSEDRSRMGMLGSGLSMEEDHMFGGAGSVFTRLVTESALDKDLGVCELGGSMVLLLIDLEAMDGRSYQYNDDCFGMRNAFAQDEEVKAELEKNWNQRLNPGEFAKEVSENWKDGFNEVMIFKRVLPSEIYGFVVPDEKARTEFIEELKKHRSDIHGVPLERCVIAAEKLKSSMKKESMK